MQPIICKLQSARRMFNSINRILRNPLIIAYKVLNQLADKTPTCERETGNDAAPVASSDASPLMANSRPGALLCLCLLGASEMGIGSRFNLGCFFVFSALASEMLHFTTFSHEMYVFYASPSTSSASFSTCPDNIPSITSKSRFLHLQHHQFLSGKVGIYVRMLKRGAGPPHNVKSEDSNTDAIPAKHLKRSGGVGRAAAPP